MAVIWRSQAGVVTGKLFQRIKPNISELGLPATRKVKKPDHLGAKRVAGSRHTLATTAHKLDFLKPQSRNTQNPTNLAEDDEDSEYYTQIGLASGPCSWNRFAARKRP